LFNVLHGNKWIGGFREIWRRRGLQTSAVCRRATAVRVHVVDKEDGRRGRWKKDFSLPPFSSASDAGVDYDPCHLMVMSFSSSGSCVLVTNLKSLQTFTKKLL
jgi:hypothetical protein